MSRKSPSAQTDATAHHHGDDATRAPSSGKTDHALLVWETELECQGNDILADLALFERLASVGDVVSIGSWAAGLMALPDIDIGVLCAELDPDRIMDTLQPLFHHPRIKRMNFIDERGPLQSMSGPENEGIYCGLRYLLGLDGEGAEETTWRLDIWFFPAAAPRPEITMRDRLLLAPNHERLAVLRIKDELIRRGVYGRQLHCHGVDVYQAVLDRGARSVTDFDRLAAP